MKKLLCITLCLFYLTLVKAQEQQKFSPEKFQADMEQFITQEAKLTSDEATKFFPLLREMHQKQRVVYDKIKKECSQRPSNEEEIKKVATEAGFDFDAMEKKMKENQPKWDKWAEEHPEEVEKIAMKALGAMMASMPEDEPIEDDAEPIEMADEEGVEE